MRVGPYLSLHRGDSHFAQLLEHNRLCESLNGLLHVSLQICTMQNLKAGMTQSNEKAKPDKIKHKVPSVLIKSIRCPRFACSEKP